MDPEEKPAESVEEAGALLGAAITRYGSVGAFSTINPPKGTHSSFAILAPVPSSELFIQLHSLRSLLRSAPQDTPLVAAPSLLAGVLMKLLGASSNLASSGGGGDPSRRTATPPMLSVPLRKLWVDCVVLCHSRGEGLSGNSRINIYGFVRSMIQLAAMNPRTARAGGGTRIAALEAISGLMKDESLAKQLGSWALDVIQLCQRALKSSGNGEPSYRIASVDTACAAAIASRISFMNTRPESNPLILKGALEDKAILEMVKLLKIAITDKFPEVRTGAARLAATLAPLLIHTSVKSPSRPDAVAMSAVMSLEDVMTIAIKNLDDESPMVANCWAEALARCMSTSIAYAEMLNAERTSNRNVEAGESSSGGGTPSKAQSGGRGTRKGVVLASSCSTIPKAMKYIVGMFIKAGGELSVTRSGGAFSVAGRALRNGYARTLVHLLRLQSTLEAVGDGKSISHKEAILIILDMVGKEFKAQLNTASGQVPANTIFGQGPKVSPADAGLSRGASARVIREGISELSNESTQISILHEINQLCEQGLATMDGNQLQVLLVELSHLLAALGEATRSAMEDLVPTLEKCLRHADQGVRHEAAVACSAIASVFPTLGRKLIQSNINTIQIEHAELMALASTQKTAVKQESQTVGRFARFRRQATPVKEVTVDESVKHKQAIHGLALMVAMVLRDLPRLQGGLPTSLLDKAVSVAEILVNTLFNDIMCNANPGGVCTCVRGGFGILCACLATGTGGTLKHIDLIFSLWQKVVKEGQRGGNFKDAHELVCTEAMLQNVVCFLRYCSELLLSVPDALSKTTFVLEGVLPLLSQKGRLGQTEGIAAAQSHLYGAKAAILEAFSWLPPGSYPIAADDVFAFAAGHIQRAVEADTICSVLQSMLSKEDKILDATTFSRATRPGQAGGANDLENDIITRLSETAAHNDRESVFSILKTPSISEPSTSDFLRSEILGFVLASEVTQKPPTALHEVGTWRIPVMPSCSSKVRLVDSSIQAFAATFTLKSGKEQQHALQMLEALLPPVHLQTEQGRRAKPKEETSLAAATNIAATLLACLKALPVFESTHNVPINLGPMWMNKAKDVFIRLLPSPSHEVRRAAAEGLGFLATLGIREDARFLQSSVLHTLDEVINGSPTQEQGKPLSIDAISAGRSAAILTLACMQRTAYRIRRERERWARERGGADRAQVEADDELPLFQILIKVLPSIAIRPTGGFLGVRTFGLHAFGLLFAYSKRLESTNLDEQEAHLFKKIVEMIEDNFLSSWTAASQDYDHNTDAEKLSSEASFVAVLLRLMTFTVPSLYRLQSLDKKIASRFSKMVTTALDYWGSHPIVQVEAMAFYEVLAGQQHLLPPHRGGVKYEEHELLSCIPTVMECVRPNVYTVHPSISLRNGYFGLESPQQMRVASRLLKALSIAGVLVVEWTDMKILSVLFAALEDYVSKKTFTTNSLHRDLAAPREFESVYKDSDTTTNDLSSVVSLLVALERQQSAAFHPVLLRYTLLLRSVLLGSATVRDDGDDESGSPFTVAKTIQNALDKASEDTAPLFEFENPVRWQVKAMAAQICTFALREIVAKHKNDGFAPVDTAVFNPRIAEDECRAACRKAISDDGKTPASSLSLNIGTLITVACGASTATVDQAELRCLQESSMFLITELIECFGSIPDPEMKGTTVLHEYIPQISASIKNALVAPSEESGSMPQRLFFAGCETLQAFLRNKVTDDRGVLKRVVRPVMPEKGDLPYFSVESGRPPSHASSEEIETENNRASLLLPIGKLWTLGNISTTDSDLLAMLGENEASVGIHAAALAIDGACLLLNSGLSLCGAPTALQDTRGLDLTTHYFSDASEIDDSAKAALSNSWAKLAVTAVSFISKALHASHEKEELKVWLKHLVPFLFAGFYHSTKSKLPGEGPDTSRFHWARSIDSTEIGGACIRSIAMLGSNEELLSLDNLWASQLEDVVSAVSGTIFSPILTGDTAPSVEPAMVKMACSLLLGLSSSASFVVNEDSMVLISILRPISQLESGKVNFEDERVLSILATCLTAMSFVVSKPTISSSLVEAMISVVLETSSNENAPPESIKKAMRLLLKACLSNNSVTARQHSDLALAMARSHDWETWSVAISMRDGAAAAASFTSIRDSLTKSSDPVQQVAVLATLRALIQGTPAPHPLVGRLICALGAEVLAVFQAYGAMEIPAEGKAYRTAICADGMKIALVAIQHFAADGTSEEDLSSFLMVLFARLIAVLRVNGLPNHPTPQPGVSDPSLGRICAQAITFVARTTPVAFKASMGRMTDQDRTVLEFAVRAEMSGYANAAAASAAPKKKLSLKGFKT